MVCVWALLQFMGGWLYGHFIEYAIHRWALHGPGKKKDSLLSFHFHEHHREARRTLMGDSFYRKFGWNGPTKELVGIFLLLMFHSPIIFIAPYFFAALVFSSISYYVYHLKAHLNPEWARVHLSWHYDHHMGPNQNMNYGIRLDVIDRLLGTHEIYYGTAAERRDHSRRLLRYVQTMRNSKGED